MSEDSSDSIEILTQSLDQFPRTSFEEWRELTDTFDKAQKPYHERYGRVTAEGVRIDPLHCAGTTEIDLPADELRYRSGGVLDPELACWAFDTTSADDLVTQLRTSGRSSLALTVIGKVELSELFSDLKERLQELPCGLILEVSPHCLEPEVALKELLLAAENWSNGKVSVVADLHLLSGGDPTQLKRLVVLFQELVQRFGEDSFQIFGVDIRWLAHAGAPLHLQLGVGLAKLHSYLSLLNSQTALSSVLRGCGGCALALGTNPFQATLGVASLRRLWRLLMTQGGVPWQAEQPKILTEPASCSHSLLSPATNLLRITSSLAAMHWSNASVMIAPPYEATDITEASRLSVAAGTILKQESHLRTFEAPFEGSWFAQDFCEQLERQAFSCYQEIQKNGGVLAILGVGGWLEGKITEYTAQRMSRLRTGQETLVGVNRFVDSTAEALSDLLSDAVSEKSSAPIFGVQPFREAEPFEQVVKRVAKCRTVGRGLRVALVGSFADKRLSKRVKAYFELGMTDFQHLEKLELASYAEWVDFDGIVFSGSDEDFRVLLQALAQDSASKEAAVPLFTEDEAQIARFASEREVFLLESKCDRIRVAELLLERRANLMEEAA